MHKEKEQEGGNRNLLMVRSRADTMLPEGQGLWSSSSRRAPVGLDPVSKGTGAQGRLFSGGEEEPRSCL